MTDMSTLIEANPVTTHHVNTEERFKSHTSTRDLENDPHMFPVTSNTASPSFWFSLLKQVDTTRHVYVIGSAANIVRL